MLDTQGMLASHGDFGQARRHHSRSQSSRIDVEVRSPQCPLNGDLPEIDDAEQDIVVRVGEKITGGSGQLFGFRRRPERELRVEQKSQGS